MSTGSEPARAISVGADGPVRPVHSSRFAATGDEVLIDFARAGTVVLRRGARISIAQRSGGQVGDLNAWSLEDTRERLWASRTALLHGMHVTTGHWLHTTWPGERPILTVVEDTVAGRRSERGARQHDVLSGRCSQDLRERRYGAATPGCQELLAGAIAGYGLGPEDVHDALNLFMITGVDDDDRVFLEPSDARRDDRFVMQAEIDCLVAIACCPGACTRPGADGLRCVVEGGA
jgi:uncharacterized protein YcgI (DUF1989 family)